MSDDSDVFGPYRLVRPLARGGMAEIFLARREGPGGFAKTVVVKRVLPQHLDNRDFVQMFLDEARLAAQLEHPNVVHISDFGQVEGRYYLAMEYLRGVDLSALARARRQAGRGVFPGPIGAAIAAQAAAGLFYAHTATTEDERPLRIVHRDISPSNLFLTFQGVVKVLDFGIAKAEGKLVETQQGVVKGKLLYMSPEQTWGKALDGRSDVWALGVVLFELLTGVRPFFRARDDSPGVLNERRTMEAIDREQPPALDADPELQRIVLRCLEKSPEARYESARLLQRDLEAWVAKQGGVSHETLAGFLQESVDTGEVERRSQSLSSNPAVAEVGSNEILPATRSEPSPRSAPNVVASKTDLEPSPSTVSAHGAAWRSKAWLGGALGTALVGVVAVVVLQPVRRDEAPPRATPQVAAAAAAVDAVDAAVDPPPTAIASTPLPLPVVDAGVAEELRVVERPAPGQRSARVKTRLRVTCAPFGAVFVDDRPRGRAGPVLEIEVPPGSHVVRCVHPSLGESAGSVTVAAGALAERQLQY